MPKDLSTETASASKAARQGLRCPDLNALIGGGCGFVGWHLCRRLSDKSSEVHTTSRTQRAAAGKGPIWWQADMTDLSSARLLGAVGTDIVFDLAGSVGASPKLKVVRPTYRSVIESFLAGAIAPGIDRNTIDLGSGSLSDGDHSLLDIAERADLPFSLIHQASESLVDCKLLEAATNPKPSNRE